MKKFSQLRMKPLRPVLRKFSEDDIAKPMFPPEEHEEKDNQQRSEVKVVQDPQKARIEFWLDHVFASEREVRNALEKLDQNKEVEVTAEALDQEIQRARFAAIDEATEMETWLPPDRR